MEPQRGHLILSDLAVCATEILASLKTKVTAKAPINKAAVSFINFNIGQSPLTESFQIS